MGDGLIAPNLPSDNSGLVASLRRTVSGVFRFGGRSTNSDLIAYAACAVALDLVIGFALMVGFEYDRFAVAKDMLQALYFVPVPALLARRLHDQDKPTTFLWLAAPGLALWLLRKFAGLTLPLPTRVKIDSLTWPLDIVSIITTMTLVVMAFLPGTVGANRFGPDPRGRE